MADAEWHMADAECQMADAECQMADAECQMADAECQIADYRGGVTCLYDTQLLGACLQAYECGDRSRPEAVRGMPDVPIAPPATGPPEGWAPVGVGFVSPASFKRGLWARLPRVLGS